MKHYAIALIPGDGVGPKIFLEPARILHAVTQKHAASIEPQT